MNSNYSITTYRGKMRFQNIWYFSENCWFGLSWLVFVLLWHLFFLSLAPVFCVASTDNRTELFFFYNRNQYTALLIRMMFAHKWNECFNYMVFGTCFVRYMNCYSLGYCKKLCLYMLFIRSLVLSHSSSIVSSFANVFIYAYVYVYVLTYT